MKKTFSILLIPFFFTCCKKSNTNQLPVLGHTGENILTCYVNGSPLIISGYQTSPCFLCTGNGVEYSYLISNISSFFIYGEQGNIQIGFDFNYNGTPCEYAILVDTTVAYPSFMAAYYNDFHSIYTNPGTVDITYFDGKIVAGTFSFDAVDSGNVVHITDGEFDINVN